jgi:transposase InsO family protein
LEKSVVKNKKKPQWVVDNVIYLKAMMPNTGCGTIANTFNRVYAAKGETVSKTFVYEKLKAHQYAVKALRRKLKHKKPKPIPVNQTWGMDFCQVKLNGQQNLVLGIIDHGSRALLKLQSMTNKSSTTVLLELIQLFRQFGIPKNIKTDNEICFNSRLITFSLKLLGIKKQTTDVACPWQNGRIERAFGTFKHMWQQVVFPTTTVIQHELTIYQTWYNDIRPHSNLNGATPKEILLNKRSVGKEKFVSAWAGILTGYYFPD